MGIAFSLSTIENVIAGLSELETCVPINPWPTPIYSTGTQTLNSSPQNEGYTNWIEWWIPESTDTVASYNYSTDLTIPETDDISEQSELDRCDPTCSLHSPSYFSGAQTSSQNERYTNSTTTRIAQPITKTPISYNYATKLLSILVDIPNNAKWQCEFKSLFSKYKEPWELFGVIRKPKEDGWREANYSAKVHFYCVLCNHSWTSMRGQVIFWFIFNYSSREGVVCAEFFGQKCDRCKTGGYQTAIWYPDEIARVLNNTYKRVYKIYYGEIITATSTENRAKRQGDPASPHNRELCQACEKGVCKVELLSQIEIHNNKTQKKKVEKKCT